jgi:hypothetical protein
MRSRRLAWLAAAAAAVVVVVARLDLGAAQDIAPGPRAAPEPPEPTPGIVAEGEEHVPGARPAPTAAPRRPGRAAPSADTAPPPAPAGAPAAAVARSYTEQSINWTGATLARQHRRLAALSAGPLRAQNRAAAADRSELAWLRRDGAGQRGTVRSVETASAHAGEMTVEVRASERAYGRSLGPPEARSAAYLARLARRAGGWRVIGWTVRR